MYHFFVIFVIFLLSKSGFAANMPPKPHLKLNHTIIDLLESGEKKVEKAIAFADEKLLDDRLPILSEIMDISHVQPCPSPEDCSAFGTWKSNQTCMCKGDRYGACCRKTAGCLGESRLDRGKKKCICKYPRHQSGERCHHVDCEHGGLRDGNGFCRDCKPLWTGLFCEVRKCFYGGSLKFSSTGHQTCVCSNPKRHTGPHCHNLVCDHGGQAKHGNDYCECPFPYTGQYCERTDASLVIIVVIVAVGCTASLLLLVRHFFPSTQKYFALVTILPSKIIHNGKLQHQQHQQHRTLVTEPARLSAVISRSNNFGF